MEEKISTKSEPKSEEVKSDEKQINTDELKRVKTANPPLPNMSFSHNKNPMQQQQFPLSPTQQNRPYPFNNVRERSGSEHWNEGDFSSDESEDTKNQSTQNDLSQTDENDMTSKSSMNLSGIPLNAKLNTFTSNSMSNLNSFRNGNNNNAFLNQNNKPKINPNQKATDIMPKLPNYNQPEKITVATSKSSIKKEKIQELFSTSKSFEDVNITLDEEDIDKYMDIADTHMRKLFTVANVDDRPLETTKWQLTEKSNAAEKLTRF